MLPEPGPAEIALGRRLGTLESQGTLIPCRGLESVFWTSSRPEDRAEAATGCEWCPALDLCAAAAEEIRPTFGIWAGRDWTPPARLKRATKKRDATTERESS